MTNAGGFVKGGLLVCSWSDGFQSSGRVLMLNATEYVCRFFPMLKQLGWECSQYDNDQIAN